MSTQKGNYRGIHNGGWKKGFLSYNFKTNEYEIVNSQGVWPVIESSVGQSTGMEDKEGVEIYAGSGGVHSEYGRYYVKFGEYRTDNDNHNVGFCIQWMGEHQARAYRKDVGWWVGEGLLFNLNTTDTSHLLEKQT